MKYILTTLRILAILLMVGTLIVLIIGILHNLNDLSALFHVYLFTIGFFVVYCLKTLINHKILSHKKNDLVGRSEF